MRNKLHSLEFLLKFIYWTRQLNRQLLTSRSLELRIEKVKVPIGDETTKKTKEITIHRQNITLTKTSITFSLLNAYRFYCSEINTKATQVFSKRIYFIYFVVVDCFTWLSLLAQCMDEKKVFWRNVLSFYDFWMLFAENSLHQKDAKINSNVFIFFSLNISHPLVDSNTKFSRTW